MRVSGTRYLPFGRASAPKGVLRTYILLYARRRSPSAARRPKIRRKPGKYRVILPLPRYVRDGNNAGSWLMGAKSRAARILCPTANQRVYGHPSPDESRNCLFGTIGPELSYSRAARKNNHPSSLARACIFRLQGRDVIGDTRESHSFQKRLLEDCLLTACHDCIRLYALLDERERLFGHRSECAPYGTIYYT